MLLALVSLFCSPAQAWDKNVYEKASFLDEIQTLDEFPVCEADEFENWSRHDAHIVTTSTPVTYDLSGYDAFGIQLRNTTAQTIWNYNTAIYVDVTYLVPGPWYAPGPVKRMKTMEVYPQDTGTLELSQGAGVVTSVELSMTTPIWGAASWYELEILDCLAL